MKVFAVVKTWGEFGITEGCEVFRVFQSEKMAQAACEELEATADRGEEYSVCQSNLV